MPGSRASVFSKAEDFEAALHEEGSFGLLVTGFRGRGQERQGLDDRRGWENLDVPVLDQGIPVGGWHAQNIFACQLGAARKLHAAHIDLACNAAKTNFVDPEHGKSFQG